ncbi:hypothetical protein AZE42_04860 [Rhizopogon vesiculosus]|uniref:Aprataxin and PNK-like factor PBZ domain-containing protein n=1 Tax=Rhizopogon vesiculosus TaxID=180088 RepID=A0A1J8R7L3_9AGAM|nr:hypothetical protein AZE42_04860 [Rhizopogon vesiculosus]
MGNTVQPLRSSFANADLVACVLTSLPDFHCLASAILTSRAVYNIFRQHPHSIVRAVAYNLVGPALPQALRFVRCQNAQLYSRPVDELLGDDDIENNPAFSRRDIRSLVAVSNTVQELENLFSLRMKNRRFQTSQLSLAESTRFQKAMYRLTLFSAIYGIESPRLVEDDSDEGLELAVEEAQNLRKSFFSCFTTPELREIQRVDFFLRGMLAGVTGHSPDSRTIVDWAVYSIYAAPGDVLDLYNEVTTLPMDIEWDDEVDQRFWVGFMGIPVASVLDDRKEPHLLPSDHKQPIVDEVIGEHDLCSQCKSDKGLELWGPSNWSYFRANPIFHAIPHLLKGYLSLNNADIGHFKSIVQETPPEQLIEGLFEYKTLAYDIWSKEDWLCEQCLEKFMREHLHLWYVGQMIKQGLAIPENCWYGYNCRTQTHRLAHAKKLNHWCAPIRGDAPP